MLFYFFTVLGKKVKISAFLIVINDIKKSFFDPYLTKKERFNEFLG
jgi:hypothetical protein